jgi:glucose-1-phosphate cytidylyltransferase
MADVTFDIKNNTTTVHKDSAEPWNVTVVDTGEHTMTGGRLKRVEEYIKEEESFCMTYGDGLSNIDISKLISFHNEHNKLASLSAVHSPARFGALEISDTNAISSFLEKPVGDGGMINGGFFVLSPKVLDLIRDDHEVWEKKPLESLAKSDNLMAYKHIGFWQPMDTLRDKNYLEDLWKKNEAPWKVW